MVTDLGPRLGNSPLSPLLYAIKYASPGAAVEFGVASGTTLGIIADAPHLNPVIGFDSFEGLPEDWRPGWEKGKFARKRPPRIPGADLVIGRFEDTLPPLCANLLGAPGWLLDLSLVHVDCDLYSSTVTVLDNIGPYLNEGTLVIFDEFHTYPGAEQHESKAWAEYTERTGIQWEPLGHGPEQLVICVR